MIKQDEISGMRLLNEFKAAHSALGECIILQSSFVDTLAAFSSFKHEEYPDQTIMIRLNQAKALIAELQKRVDYIEAGIEDVGTRTTVLE